MLDPGDALQAVTYSQGGGLQSTAGSTFSFVIDSRDAAASKILDECLQCSGYIVVLQPSDSLTCDSCEQTIMPELNGGLATGNVTLFEEGSWSIAVYVENYATRLIMHIQGSPMILKVTANKISPANCIASGGGLVGTALKREGVVIITARDAWDNDRSSLDSPPDEVMMAFAGVFVQVN